MAIFVVFRITNPEKIETSIKRAYPNDHFDLGSGQWLVSATGTAKEVSEKIGITKGDAGGDAGSAIVFSMGSYFGRATSDIWEWIKAKAETTASGLSSEGIRR
jgi:hypothetical protein